MLVVLITEKKNNVRRKYQKMKKKEKQIQI